jgi:branched-chain amino acid transport system substrate-binding protein
MAPDVYGSARLPSIRVFFILFQIAWFLPIGRVFAQFVSQEHPVQRDEIRIGMSSSQTGRSGFVGEAVKRGCKAYFSKVNRQGGVFGRKLVLVSYDDRNEPLEAVANTQRLINADRVFALIGFNGAANCRAVLPMLNDARIVLVGPVTGAAGLHDPVPEMVFNTRPSYEEETEVLIDRMVSDLKLTRVAILCQRDSFGEGGKASTIKALESRGLSLAEEGWFLRNSLDVQDALKVIIAAKPEAIVMFGGYKACAEFVRRAKAGGLNKIPYCLLTSAATEDFIKLLGSQADGILVPEVVPSPLDASLELVRNYQADMKAADDQNFDHGSLEGYVDALVLTDALRRAGENLTQETFIHALETTHLDFGAFGVRFASKSHEGNDKVFLTKVQEGQLVTVDRVSWADFGR